MGSEDIFCFLWYAFIPVLMFCVPPTGFSFVIFHEAYSNHLITVYFKLIILFKDINNL